jgi:hypothetical protein
MSFSKSLKNVSLCISVSCFAFTAAAQTATYSLDHTAVGAFGAGSYGTVTLTQSFSDVLVNVSLRNDLNFVDTGSHSAFSFNLGGVSSVNDITNVSFANGFGSGFGVSTGTTNAPFSQFSYEINCVSNCVSGGSGGGYVDPLSFTVHNATIANFNQLSTGGGTAAYFAMDVINGSGNTGTVGAINAGVVTAVPEPETYAMLLAGLVLIGSIARRRKQKVLTA